MTKVGTTCTFGRAAEIGSNQIRNLQTSGSAEGPQNQQTQGSVGEVGLGTRIQALEANEAKSERVRHALAKTRFPSNGRLQTLRRELDAAMRVVEQSPTNCSKCPTERQSDGDGRQRRIHCTPSTPSLRDQTWIRTLPLPHWNLDRLCSPAPRRTGEVRRTSPTICSELRAAKTLPAVPSCWVLRARCKFIRRRTPCAGG